MKPLDPPGFNDWQLYHDPNRPYPEFEPVCLIEVWLPAWDNNTAFIDTARVYDTVLLEPDLWWRPA